MRSVGSTGALNTWTSTSSMSAVNLSGHRFVVVDDLVENGPDHRQWTSLEQLRTRFEPLPR